MKSQRGKTGVSLLVKADKENPLRACTVKIYSGTEREILGRFDIATISNPLHFEVADELVDSVEVWYFLEADIEVQSHIFMIKPGELKKLSAL